MGNYYTLIVIDFKKLNAITVREPFTMPSVEDIISKLGSETVLSKIDLQKGFHQVPMEHTSKQYTAFHCLQGKFQYTVMPFGLTNAPGIANAAGSKRLGSLFSSIYR